jgi:hypothetical protein
MKYTQAREIVESALDALLNEALVDEPIGPTWRPSHKAPKPTKPTSPRPTAKPKKPLTYPINDPRSEDWIPGGVPTSPPVSPIKEALVGKKVKKPNSKAAKKVKHTSYSNERPSTPEDTAAWYRSQPQRSDGLREPVPDVGWKPGGGMPRF